MNEIILDTNILLRHFLQDIRTQSLEATRLIESIEKGEKTGYLSLLVVNEVIWILKRFYKIERKEYLPILLTLLQLNNIKTMEVKKETLEKMKKKEVDFTDVYLFEIAGDRTIASFDKDFEKLHY
ncbi:MAG TPA: PIN domain-containing protein [Candidatus Woesebacteria bacterium]|nr:PIN domain-containing protein [Candidatus Woesebacteria bacterium]